MASSSNFPENRLARETSPYLLQHKNNPVDWWPWGPDALAEAKRTAESLHALRSANAGSVRIGVSEVMSAQIVPLALARVSSNGMSNTTMATPSSLVMRRHSSRISE